MNPVMPIATDPRGGPSNGPSGRPRRRAGRLLAAAITCTALVSGLVTTVGSAAAAADPTPAAPAQSTAGSAFAAGNVVVYRVGDGSAALSSAGAPVFLDEYSPSGALLDSTALPTAAAGTNNPLVAGGSATSEGGLTLSADSRYLIATGYDAAPGTAGLSSSAAASVPRTIARVDADGDVDSSTALTDFADGNNPRSAVSQDGSEFWVGGAAGGVRYAALGASTSTSLVSSSYKNVRQLEIADGQLYTSADPTKASVTVAAVGTGLPTTGSQPVTNLPFTASPTEPYGYQLLTLGSGSTPDTLYVADNSTGAVVKYGLSNGSWVQQGSVPVSGVTGLTANDSDGTVTLYATSSGASGTGGTLYKLTDASGTGGTLTGTASVIANAPANEAFRGVAFAPGTVTGSGGGSNPTTSAPTVSTAETGLPAALGDPTNATLPVTIGDPLYPASELSVTATSSDQSVAPAAGISLTGSGADQTLTVTPGAVGYSTITLTVTAPDGTSASTQVQYGVSANLGDPSQRYFSGAGNGSTAIDVGDGYMIVGDDESNVLHLYNETQSGPAVKTFDFTSELPYGTTEVDIEASARSGDMLYWTGSMSNNTDGKQEPSRSTLFAARITGSGADTQLTYVGSYTGLQSDLVAWDQDNGHGLGANYLGLADSVQSGVDGHGDDALNVEGMEFAGSSSSTAYLAFRAPLEPTDNRHLAMLIPLTNIDQLVGDGNPGSTHATFGAPIFMDLGGLGVREIRENADGQYLIVAGTADGSNTSFVLYSWDGNPSDPPLQTGTTLPLEPAGVNQGSWETLVSVPDPLVAGANVQLIQDDGDTAWYGDTLTSKTGLSPDLDKDLGQVFSYVPGTPLGTSTEVTADPAAPSVGQPVTYTATVTAPSGTTGTPTGSVAFSDAGTGDPITGCAAQPLTASADTGTASASCTTSYPAIGGQSASADYSGDGSFAASSGGGSVNVVPAATSTAVTSSANPAPYGTKVTFTATVTPVGPASGTPTGGVVFSLTTHGRTSPLHCGTNGGVQLSDGAAQCTVDSADLGGPNGGYQVSAAYGGSADYTAGTGTLSQQVGPEPTTVRVSALLPQLLPGEPDAVLVSVTPLVDPFALLGGTVSVTVTGADGSTVPCHGPVSPGLIGVCTLWAGELTTANSPYTVTAHYSGDADFAPGTGSTTLAVQPARR